MEKKTRTKAAPKADTPVQIKGRAIALVGRYHTYDPKNPTKTPVTGFALAPRADNLSADGVLTGYYAKEGYVYVGDAEITITLLADKTVVKNRVATLRAERVHVQATANARVTQIDRDIQKLLAITMD